MHDFDYNALLYSCPTSGTLSVHKLLDAYGAAPLAWWYTYLWAESAHGLTLVEIPAWSRMQQSDCA